VYITVHRNTMNNSDITENPSLHSSTLQRLMQIHNVRNSDTENLKKIINSKYSITIFFYQQYSTIMRISLE